MFLQNFRFWTNFAIANFYKMHYSKTHFPCDKPLFKESTLQVVIRFEDNLFLY